MIILLSPHYFQGKRNKEFSFFLRLKSNNEGCCRFKLLFCLLPKFTISDLLLFSLFSLGLMFLPLIKTLLFPSFTSVYNSGTLFSANESHSAENSCLLLSISACLLTIPSCNNA